jgi:hypothetical protein
MSRVSRKLVEYLKWYSKKIKQLNFIKLRKEVEIGANGTQKYMIKEGKNKGKIL